MAGTTVVYLLRIIMKVGEWCVYFRKISISIMSCLKNRSKPKLSLEENFKNPNIENMGQAALANIIRKYT